MPAQVALRKENLTNQGRFFSEIKMPVQLQWLVEIIWRKRETKERRQKAWASERVSVGAEIAVILGCIEMGNSRVDLKGTQS